MSIYQKKQTWKIFLVILAVCIIAGSLYYTNNLVRKIATEEKRKVRLWAEAIQKKAKLVVYTQELFDKLGIEERKKVELFAKGSRQLAGSDVNMGDITFILDVIRNNETVPVILSDDNGRIISYRNLDSTKTNDKQYLKQQLDIMRRAYKPIVIPISHGKNNYLYYKDSRIFTELKTTMNDIIKSFISEIVANSASVPVILTDVSKEKIISYGNIDSAIIHSPALLKKKMAEMQLQNAPMAIEIGEGNKNFIFYEESSLLKQLKYYPYVQFAVIGLFLIIAYTLFSTARKSEQNQVWVGMSKETAHQLGTPLSSLMAWLEILKAQGVDEDTTMEIEKDLKRLQTITDRFSKIGSTPQLVEENIYHVMDNAIGYLKSRVSSKVKFSIHCNSPEEVVVPVCVPLFEWVVENLVKNAVDAMDGVGELKVDVLNEGLSVAIDITDTGKGIDKSAFKTVFEPGFTTKKRGWGLGLSLAKRIIENYHRGKIFVKHSEPGKGTTFRIVLSK